MAIVNPKILAVLAAYIACLLLFTACGAKEPPANAAEPALSSSAAITTSDQSQFMWGIEIISCETTDNLSTSQSVMQYGGTVEEVSYEAKPGDGNTFLLVQMVVEKQEAGAATFEWDKLYVLDAQGNKFFRHPNDTFLESHNFKRIKSTDLTIGKNEGFICFEINKEATNDALVLIYDAPEGENKIILRPKESGK